MLQALAESLATLPWETPALEAGVRDFAATQGLKLGSVAQPLRAALTGTTASPPIFDVMAVLGREESLARLADAVKT
jgi:glutamyl-tRNA synthetase